jgi:hypothetical protein
MNKPVFVDEVMPAVVFLAQPLTAEDDKKTFFSKLGELERDFIVVQNSTNVAKQNSGMDRVEMLELIKPSQIRDSWLDDII